MVIGFDGSRAFVKNKTGTENYSTLLLESLARIDKDNQYIVYLRPNFEGDFSQYPSNFKFKQINFNFLWTQVGLALEIFSNPPDILFVPAHTLPLFRPASVKTIMTIHDMGSEFLPTFHQLKQQIYLKFITKYQLKSATKLIAVSEATKNDLVKSIKVDKANIKVIYEGCRFEGLKKPEKLLIRSVLDKYSVKDNNYFLFVGTVQPRKNLLRIIEAFALLLQIYNNSSDNIKLLICGSSGWKDSEIYLLPKKFNIEKHVKFVGRVSDQELSCLYSAAKGLVFPSLFEGFGLPILEAFNFGCPVITSNVSSMPEIAGDAALVVDPYDIKQIVDALIQLQDDKLRYTLINKGYSQLKKFSFDKAAQQTHELFNEVIKDNVK